MRLSIKSYAISVSTALDNPAGRRKFMQLAQHLPAKAAETGTIRLGKNTLAGQWARIPGQKRKRPAKTLS
jgi:hypothetical protein